MNRRDAIGRVALLMGGTLIGSELFLNGCKSTTNDVANLFEPEHISFFNEVGETIIPETSTPGAKAVNVGAFMALMVRVCYAPEDQKTFLTAKENINQAAKKQFDKDFLACNITERTAVLNKLDKEQKAYISTKEKKAPNHYFRMVKSSPF